MSPRNLTRRERLLKILAGFDGTTYVKRGIDRADCHIGMMDVETCRRVVTICSKHAYPAFTHRS